MQEAVLNLLTVRRGHFRLESNHHGNLWLDLEVLCQRPEEVKPLAAELARRLAMHRIEAVCGPLVEGAFIALMVAAELGVEFFYAERFAPPQSDALFPVSYRVPQAQRGRLQGRRVAIVNDVINAGSAVRGTLADLRTHGAEVVAIGSLLVLGDSAKTLAEENHLKLAALAALPNPLWTLPECPLCAAGVALHEPSP